MQARFCFFCVVQAHFLFFRSCFGILFLAAADVLCVMFWMYHVLGKASCASYSLIAFLFRLLCWLRRFSLVSFSPLLPCLGWRPRWASKLCRSRVPFSRLVVFCLSVRSVVVVTNPPPQCARLFVFIHRPLARCMPSFGRRSAARTVLA